MRILIDCKDLTEREQIGLLLNIHKYIINETADSAYVPLILLGDKNGKGVESQKIFKK